MAHDVFISYSSTDKPVADAVCATLEALRIRCCIAPRDIQVDEISRRSTEESIRRSRALVLILSAGANNSMLVVHEVKLALFYHVPIIPFRIDYVPPSGEMQYHVREIHWIEAQTPPLQQHLDNLARVVQARLAESRALDTPAPGSQLAATLRRWLYEEQQWSEEMLQWLAEHQRRSEHLRQRLDPEQRRLLDSWQDYYERTPQSADLRRWLYEEQGRLEDARQWLDERPPQSADLRRWLHEEQGWLRALRQWLDEEQRQLTDLRQWLDEVQPQWTDLRQWLDEEECQCANLRQQLDDKQRRLQDLRPGLEERMHQRAQEEQRLRQLREAEEVLSEEFGRAADKPLEPRERPRLAEQLRRETARLLQREAAQRAQQAQQTPDMLKTLVSCYYPKEVCVHVWQPLYAYIFRDSAAGAVEANARERLGPLIAEYRRRSEALRQPIATGAAITATPNLEGFRFNPQSLTTELQEDWHRLEFKLRAQTATVGKASNGLLTFTVDGVIIADIPISIYVGERESAAELAVASGTPYHAIFCSYSHRDKRVVQHVESACKTLGIAFLRDVVTLRSGQRWQDELRALIEQADIFQLFWSDNAARSEYVEQEWRHALGLGGTAPGFIRPVYWDEPLHPPPAELSPFHFAFVPELAPWLRRCVSLAYRGLARFVPHPGRK
jgi:hypothetical protein